MSDFQRAQEEEQLSYYHEEEAEREDFYEEGSENELERAEEETTNLELENNQAWNEGSMQSSLKNALLQSSPLKEIKERTPTKGYQFKSTKYEDALHSYVGKKLKAAANQQSKPKKEEEPESFKPKINPLSKAIANSIKKTVGGQSRGDYLYKRAQESMKKKLEKQEERIREKEQKDIEGCTFVPNREKSKLVSFGGESSDPYSIAERSLQWKEWKEHKMQQERDLKKDIDLVDCTFQPTIQKRRIHHKQQQSYDQLLQTSGFQKHMERQYQALKNKEDKAKREAKNEGRGWKPSVTVPKAFNLSQPKNEDIIDIRSSRNPEEYFSRTSELKSDPQMGAIPEIDPQMTFDDAVLSLRKALHSIEL